MINAILVDPLDDVVVLIHPISRGDFIQYQRDGQLMTLPAVQDIPIYHKAAIHGIPAGNVVKKYGEHIGIAIQDISAGQHVHIQNIISEKEYGGGKA